MCICYKSIYQIQDNKYLNRDQKSLYMYIWKYKTIWSVWYTIVILTERNGMVPVNQLKILPTPPPQKNPHFAHVFRIRWTLFFSMHMLHFFLIQEQSKFVRTLYFSNVKHRATQINICMVFAWFLQNITNNVSVLGDLYMTFLFPQ